MKNLLSIALLTLVIFSSSSAFSQMGTEENDSKNYLTNRAITIVAAERNFSGSAYENKEFVSGYVFKDGKPLASNVALRYNAKRDEFEVKKTLGSADTSGRVLKRSDEIYVKILNKVYVYSPLKEGISKGGYFIVIHEGDTYSLYKKLTKQFIEGREAINSITRDTPPAYQDKEVFYLVNNASENFTELPKSRKRKLKVFENNKKAVKAFVKENRLNLNKDYDLAKLVKYYDTL